jgi:hypothetical protein
VARLVAWLQQVWANGAESVPKGNKNGAADLLSLCNLA